MTVAVYVNDESDVVTLVPWGIRIATSARTNVLIVVPKRTAQNKEDCWIELTRETSSESPLHKAILDCFDALDSERYIIGSKNWDEAQSFDSSVICVTAKEFASPDPNASLVSQIDELDINVLLIDSHEPTGVISNEGDDGPRNLLFDTECETLVVRGKPPQEDRPLKILVAADKEAIECEVSLRRAQNLVKENDGSVTFLFVRPDDDEVAEQVGLVTANRVVNRVPDMRHQIECRVSLAEKLMVGVLAQPDLETFDLVITNARGSAASYKFVNAWEKEEVTNKVPLAIVRPAVPLATRLWTKLTKSVRSVVPQIDRELRVKLVDRLNTSSRWDFDFVALISLSTLIAALGLIRNSGAVVIGAMLIAPLMTPLVGIGFAMVQGNLQLIRQSLRSLVFGFALAFIIGVLVGTFVNIFGFVPGGMDQIPELQARNNPNFLDLVVALVSGIAGAYAWGRPNLVSALPGVAIAAALVPPIATSGIALSCMSFQLSLGSLLLFLTNIVTIILGCTIVFWAVGIDSRKKSKKDDRKERSWPRYWLLGFVLLSLILASVMPYVDSHHFGKSKNKPEVKQKKEPVPSLLPPNLPEQPMPEHKAEEKPEQSPTTAPESSDED